MEKDRKAIIFNLTGAASILFILFTGPLYVVENLTFLMVQIFGILLIIWSLIAKKLNKHHSSVDLPPGYFFVNKGPYEIIRHPIYAGILLISSSWVQYEFLFLRVVALGVLFLAIMLKIIREEDTMEQKIKDYAEYKSRTKRLIPYLF